MCFSAEANFVASAVIGAVGVATLRHASRPRAVLFAGMPLLFALHQFTEGFVWLGLDGRIRPEARDHMAFLFVLFAQGALPILMPLAVLLLEPRDPCRWVIAGLTAFGAMLGAYILYGLIAFPTQVRAEHHSIVYDNPVTETAWIAAAYVLATCGALLASSHRVVRWFGALNVVGVAATLLVKGYAFTSVWCLYAAILSVVLYWQFRGRHLELDQPRAGFAPEALAR